MWQARALLIVRVMSARAESLSFPSKVICFRCRVSGCGCVAQLNRVSDADRSGLAAVSGSVKSWLLAMSGACLAGGAIGALVALWM
jgi:hypothetical protein